MGVKQVGHHGIDKKSVEVAVIVPCFVRLVVTEPITSKQAITKHLVLL